MAAVSVVIVSYNTREHLRACLATVLPECPSDVIVADNGSTDGTLEMLATDFPTVAVLPDPGNPGYGAAANNGVRRTQTPYVLVLNSDTLLGTGALQALVGYLDDNLRAGILGPRLLNPDGSLQPSCRPFPSPWLPLHRHDRYAGVMRRIPWLRDRSLASWAHDRPRRVPWVVGAALAIRREAFDAAGGFDESFFMYSEEVDLCRRMYRLGWETHFAPVAVVTHVGMASTRQYRAAMLAQLFLSSMRYYERHYSGLSLSAARLATRAAIAVRLVRDRVAMSLVRDPADRLERRDAVAVWREVLGKLGSTGRG